MLTVDNLAQEIRRVDGNHSLGAGALAEALMPFFTAALAVQTQQGGMTGFVTQAMRKAADEARNAALLEDENDQIGALNAALDAAFAAHPAQGETPAQEFGRLIAEYRAETEGPIRAEAWNLIADFAVENATAISSALEDATRYKSMFDDAVAQHNAQMERAEKAEYERDEARQIVQDIHWMARRYASGRGTYAPGLLNDAISKAVAGRWLTEDNVSEPLLAEDPADAPATIASGTAPSLDKERGE